MIEPKEPQPSQNFQSTNNQDLYIMTVAKCLPDNTRSDPVGDWNLRRTHVHLGSSMSASVFVWIQRTTYDRTSDGSENVSMHTKKKKRAKLSSRNKQGHSIPTKIQQNCLFPPFLLFDLPTPFHALSQSVRCSRTPCAPEPRMCLSSQTSSCQVPNLSLLPTCAQTGGTS